MATELNINAALLDSLELGDIVDVEEVAGVSLGAFQDGATMPFKGVVALAWVVRRKDEPGFTYEQAKRLKMSDLADIFAPTPAVSLEPMTAARRGSSRTSKANS